MSENQPWLSGKSNINFDFDLMLSNASFWDKEKATVGVFYFWYFAMYRNKLIVKMIY